MSLFIGINFNGRKVAMQHFIWLCIFSSCILIIFVAAVATASERIRCVFKRKTFRQLLNGARRRRQID